VAPPSACRPAGARILLASALATVFSTGGYLYGCLLARGVPEPLNAGPVDDSVFPSSTMTLAGPFLAYGYNYFSEIDEVSTVAVLDLRDPEYGSGMTRSASMEKTEYGRLLATKLRTNGAVAWISCPGGYSGSPPARACRRGGGLVKHVWVYGSRRLDPRLVDRGRMIRPATLRLRGSLLSWRNGRKLHRARLR
jgi:hypothetical protein